MPFTIPKYVGVIYLQIKRASLLSKPIQILYTVVLMPKTMKETVIIHGQIDDWFEGKTKP